MRLSYDIAIIGEANVQRALAGIERRFVTHNRAVMKSAASRMNATGVVNPTSVANTAARDRAREEKRLASERARAEEHVFRIRMRHFRQIQTEEDKITRSRERSAQQQSRRETLLVERDHKNRLRATERSRRQTLGTAGSSVRGTLGTLASLGGTGLAIAGGFSASDAINRQRDLGRRYTDLVVQSRAPGTEFDPNKRKEVRSTVEALAVERGIEREDLTGALEMGVQKTGDLDKSLENLEKFAVLGQAFKTSTTEMTAAAAVLQDRFGLSADEIADTMATLGSQGRKASFELADMASLVESLAASGTRFDFKGTQGVKTLGGLAQMARGSTKSSEQAATALEATLRQLITKAGDLRSGEALGKRVDVFEGGDATNEARDIRAVITDVISAAGGDKTKLQKLLVEGGATVTPLVAAYNQASRAAGGGEKGDVAGRAAIEAMFADAIDAGGTYADAQRDAATIMAEDSSKMTRSQEQVAIALGELSPLIVDLAGTIADNKEVIKQAVDGAIKLVQFFVENPFKGIGAIIATKLIADLAMAQIGQKVSDLLTNTARPGMPVPGAPGVPGAVVPGGKAPTGFAATSSLGVLGYAALAATAEESAYAYANEGQKDGHKFRSGLDVAKRVKDGAFDSKKTIIGELADGTVQNVDALMERTGLGGIDKHLGEGTRSKIGSFLTGGGLERANNGTRWGEAPSGAVGAGSEGLANAAAELTKAAQQLASAGRGLSENPLNRTPSPTEPRRK